MCSGQWLPAKLLRSYSKQRRLGTPLVRTLVRLRIPVGLQSMLEGSAWILFTVLVARLGAVKAAAHQIALNLMSVAYMLSFGVSIAATTLVG